MLAETITLLAALAAPPAAVSLTDQAPPVRVKLNSGGDYQPGDRVTVEVETGDRGHLAVFRMDGDGYIRMIFPLDPDLDTYVEAGRRYALRGRGESQSFYADDRGGTGLILAILAARPLDFSEYADEIRWDYNRLRLDDPAGDVETQLLDIAARMTRGDRFEYDMIGYRVWGPGYESAQPVIVAGGGYDPYYSYPSHCLACPWDDGHVGVSISIGNRYGWYDPWYDPWFDPWYGYRYNRHGWGYGWGGWNNWGRPYRPIRVVNPLPRPVVPDTPYGFRSRPRAAAPTPTTAAPRLTDPVGPVTPTPAPNYDGRSRARTGSSTPAPATTAPGRAVTPGTGSVPTPSSRPAAPRSEPRPSTGQPSREPTSTDRSRSRGNTQPAAVTQPAPVERPVVTQTRRVAETPVVHAPTRTEERPTTRARGTQERTVTQPQRTEERPVVQAPRTQERPVYRPPVQTPRAEPRRETAPASRPASSSPPRSVQRPPASSTSRPATPAASSSRPSAPAASSSPKSGSSTPAQSSGSSSRPRSRGGN